MQIKDLIWIKKKSLSKKFCQSLIKKFENDDRKSAGMVGSDNGGICENRDIKRSVDLMITHLPEWNEEDKILYNALTSQIGKYLEYFESFVGKGLECIDNLKDTGYQIQKTKPGDFYHWHHDFCIGQEGSRLITFIWYLNDIQEDGYTEFIDGTKIQPETGKLILFPATWNYIHRGYPPKSETKYICTGWVYGIG
jgi:hypothetical protein